MRLSMIHKPRLVMTVSVILGGCVTLVYGGQPEPPRRPTFDLFDRFDEEQSPLQKGLLDARDKKWRKNIKLGPDPRCSRVVRKYARHNDRTPKLCSDLNEDLEGIDVGREECVRFYCCEEPSSDLMTCTGDDDQAVFGCAIALMDGDDANIVTYCAPPAPPVPASAGLADPPERSCLEQVFGRQGGSNRYVDCLDDPDRNGDGEIDQRCKKVFDTCDDMPIVVARSDQVRSSILKSKRGGLVGKRIQTSTVIHYDMTKQRRSVNDTRVVAAGDDSWDPIQVSKFRKGQARVPGRDRQAGGMLSSGAFNLECDPQVKCDANDDGDCYDKVTGRHYGEDQCFDDTGRLNVTLMDPTGPCPVEGALTCCQHKGVEGDPDSNTGEYLYGDDCYDTDESGTQHLRTTLVQMIDEDPEDALNDDGDCYLEGTQFEGLTSDCVLEDGSLRAGYKWNVNEESCVEGQPANNDNDCMGIALGEGRDAGRIGFIDSNGFCVDGFSGEILGETANEDYLPLVDEDCSEQIDNDGDGSTDEDGPEAGSPFLLARAGKAALLRAETEACEKFYDRVGQNAGLAPGELTPEGDEWPSETRGCNLTRALRVHANKKADDDDEYQNDPRTRGKKFFDVDAHGKWADEPSAGIVHPKTEHDPRGNSGNKKYKYEKRKVLIDEVFTVKCKRVKNDDGQWVDTEYDEANGVCVPVVTGRSKAVLQGVPPTGRHLQGSRQMEDAVRGLASSGKPGPMVAERADSGQDSCEPPYCDRAMMGFTFAPPVIAWGWQIREEVCIFGFCFDIIYIRIGYEFNLAAGLRLPVEINFEGEPGSIDDWLDGQDNDTAQDPEPLVDEVLAEESFNLKTTLKPKDFTVADYQQFCTEHYLNEPWYIANCGDRFAFPDFLDRTDGDEFVAQYSIFAGLKVVLFEIPLINWAIDSGMDVPAACTMFKILSGLEGMSWEDMYHLVTDLASAGNRQEILQSLKDNLGNCGSFTTPFGLDDDGYLRGFPFLEFSRSIRADCFDAYRNGEVVTINGQPIPICTNFILGVAGASLGVGLGLDATAGSRLITADSWSTSKDATGNGGELAYEHSDNEPEVQPTIVGPILADNYDHEDDPTTVRDYAHVQLKDFTYYLNALQITLSANLEFGGILSPIPDIGSFPIYNLILDTGHYGIPIPQHAYTEPVEVKLRVENYGLQTKVDHESQQVSPGCKEDDPGSEDECPPYQITVRNTGSVKDGFDNFEHELSNWRIAAAGSLPDGFEFGINPNSDFDCVPEGQDCVAPHIVRGSACYELNGLLKAGMKPCNDEEDGDIWDDLDGDGFGGEDPPGDDDGWVVAWDPADRTIRNVAKHTDSKDALSLRLSPWADVPSPPGFYPIRVTGDSQGAQFHGLAPEGPRHNPDKGVYDYRIDAPRVFFAEVIEFFNPQVKVEPAAASVRPGDLQLYDVWGRNGGNVPDAMETVTQYPDFNQGGCTLVTLGHHPDCPYRAVPTSIPGDWLVDEPPDHFPIPPATTMLPCKMDSSQFGIDVPSEWAGMEDTTYRFEITASSTGQPLISNSVVVEHTVISTFESRTRYIGLEIQELIDEIEGANAAGIQTGGALPIALHPVQMTNQRALDRILAGKPERALSAHRANIRQTEAFIRALDGFSGRGTRIPEEYYSDWMDRANAIIADLNLTIEIGLDAAKSDRSGRSLYDARRAGGK